MQIINCPGCDAQLLLSNSRAPKCGNCGRSLSRKIKEQEGLIARLRNRWYKKPEALPVSPVKG